METIVEETSDDLRSESDYSVGPVGWPDSDSDAHSVIHVPNHFGKFMFSITILLILLSGMVRCQGPGKDGINQESNKYLGVSEGPFLDPP